MRIRVGYEFLYSVPQPTPMILAVSIHYSRASDIIIPDYVTTDPSVLITGYRDGFGNWCNRLVAPTGTDSDCGQRRGERHRLGRPRGSFRHAAPGELSA